MRCHKVDVAGVTAIVCTSGPHRGRAHVCVECGMPAEYQCDDEAVGHVCSAPLCSRHAFVAGANRHLCPQHVTNIERFRKPLKKNHGPAPEQGALWPSK